MIFHRLHPRIAVAVCLLVEGILVSPTHTTAMELGKPWETAPEQNPHRIDRHNDTIARVAEAAKKGGPKVYFIGDSITELWSQDGKEVWKTEIEPLDAMNTGVSGDKTQNMLYRLENKEFDGISPRVVVVLAGINNIIFDPSVTPEDLVRGIEQVVKVVRTKSPKSEVLLLSILPAGKPDNPLRERIKTANKLLKKHADGKQVHFLDIHDAFLQPDGNFIEETSNDQVHLTEKGYAIWAKAMKPKLNELLKKSAKP